MVELTDILLDAWSMTSIVEPMPGRPEVGPWLRGIDDELPQTTIAWRAEIDLDGFADLDIGDIEEWFDTHGVLTHEALSVKTSDASAWFKERWNALPEAQQRELDQRAVVIDRAGIQVVPLSQVITRLSRKAADADAFLRDAEVIVPVSFGGIRRGIGLLDHTQPKLDKAEEEKTFEEQSAILKQREDDVDVADIAPGARGFGKSSRQPKTATMNRKQSAMAHAHRIQCHSASALNPTTKRLSASSATSRAGRSRN